jgi:hypothetical protein
MLKYTSLLLLFSLLFMGHVALRAADVDHVDGNESIHVLLPAPTNLHITGYTATSVSLAWDAVPGATNYLVETFLGNNPLPLASIITPNTAYTVTGLTPNLEYRFEVAGIDTNNEIGERAEIFGKSGIVMDLVPDRTSTPAIKEVAPDPGSNNNYTLDWVADRSYWFEVHSNGGPYCRYKFTIRETNGDKVEVWQPEGFLATHPKGYEIDGNWSQPTAEDAVFIRVSDVWNPIFPGIGDLSVLHIDYQSVLKLFWDPNSSNYTFSVWEEDMPEGRSEQIGQVPIPDTDDIQISPNPFQSQIQIDGLNPDAETTLQLFHFDGRLAKSQQVTTAQKYTLPTHELSPGVYFLRLESEGVQKTHRLVKVN